MQRLSIGFKLRQISKFLQVWNEAKRPTAVGGNSASHLTPKYTSMAHTVVPWTASRLV